MFVSSAGKLGHQFADEVVNLLVSEYRLEMPVFAKIGNQTQQRNSASFSGFWFYLDDLEVLVIDAKLERKAVAVNEYRAVGLLSLFD
ncbi:MAG: hypothetical protein AAB388_02700 [Patescibacteria group bacterium]